MLTTEDVLGLTGLPASVLRDWIDKGHVTPAEPGGKGKGNTAWYTVTQAVGLAVAVEVRGSPRGCVLGWIEQIVRAFEDVSETWLAKKFSEGKTAFVTVHQGRPLLQAPETYPQPDVQAALARVQAAAQRRPECEK